MKLYTILLLGTIIWFSNAARTHDILDIIVTLCFTIVLFGNAHYEDMKNED